MINDFMEKNKTVHWRDIWRLISPFWSSEEKGRAWSLLGIVVLLSLAIVYLNVLFNQWNRVFYDALQTKNFEVFKSQLLRFTWITLLYILCSIYKIYLIQGLQIRWRYWMTHQYMTKWLAHHNYYYIEQQKTVDNPDQRIAEDLNTLTSSALFLTLGLLSSIITLITFISVLWSVSGPLCFSLYDYCITIPGYMVWFTILYAVIGSFIIWKVGRPLVHRDFIQEKCEADFRFSLIRIRENNDAIALYQGELHEKKKLSYQFRSIQKNWWSIIRISCRLNVASNFYGQFAIIFPIVVAAPRYFSGTIQLGTLMQINSAFSQIQSSLSWFIDTFPQLANWKSCVNRLVELNTAIDYHDNQKTLIERKYNSRQALSLQELTLTVSSNGRKPLFAPITVSLASGERVLIAGPSGCGKSILFRAIAGIWPYGRGSITLQEDRRIFFLPQRSYIPIGTLKSALCYPDASEKFTEEQMKTVLIQCQLRHLLSHLSQAENWNHQLSLGEQQKLAFARILLMKPEILFLDEATSALDDENEQRMYSLLTSIVPRITLVSIAHRATSIVRYHTHCWRFMQHDKDKTERITPHHDKITLKESII